jgi:hypothetical protein
VSVREDLPVLPQAHSPRGLGTFLLSCGLGGVIGAMVEFGGNRHTDITIGIAIYFVLVALARIWVWSQIGSAERSLRRRNYEQALGQAESAIAFFGKFPWLDAARAGLLGEMGLTSQLEQAHAHRITAIANLGRLDDAKSAFEQMKSTFPDGPANEAMRHFLEARQRLA